MSRKASSSAPAATPPALSTTLPSPSPSTSLATDPLPAVRVNPAHLAELKTALDEVVKNHLTSQRFTPSHMHALVHLVLGYASVALALGSALYPYVYRDTTFDESRPVLIAGAAGYGALQALLWAWKRWVERGEVFRGKRRRVVKRIETDLVKVNTSTSFLPAPAPMITLSPHSRPASPASPASPISPLSPSLGAHEHDTRPGISTGPARRAGGRGQAEQATLDSTHEKAETEHAERAGEQQSDAAGPTYLVHLTLTTTSNGGKSLLRRARVVAGRPVGSLVDAAGGVEAGEAARWLDALLADAGVVRLDEARE
ncbi:hypothetical protein Q5752_003230 [Cryptotrichosporon argae]